MGVGELFTKTLREAVNGVAIFDYGKKEDFEILWGMKSPNGSSALLDSFKENREIVVVWDGRDVGGDQSANLLKPHLTPLDWALAASLAVLEKSEADAFDSIHIVDITGKVHEEWALRMRHQLLAEMPWVTLHAPLIPHDAAFREDYLPIVFEEGKGGLVRPVNSDSWHLIPSRKKLSEYDKRARDLRKTALEYSAKQWRASVSQTNDHHDLNNLVGPQIISRYFAPFAETDATSSGTSLNLSAFLQRVEWSGLLTGRKEVDYVAPSIEGPLNILAIDDQLGRGWDSILADLVGIPRESLSTPQNVGASVTLLGTGNGLSLYGTTTPGTLLADLGISIKTNAEGTAVNVETSFYDQRIFNSPIQDKDAARPWMLVLDLRLFSNEASKERQWYLCLAKAALKIAAMKQENLAWRGFEEDKDQIKHLAEGGDLDEMHLDTAISLFARLCALRWPSVPIIVFSSTARRGLIAKLANHGNIFLSSPKPNVLAGNPIEQIGAFTERWRREFLDALKLVDVQSKILRLHDLQLELRKTEVAEGAGDGRIQLQARHYHAVIALDETGDFKSFANSAVGGVLLISEASSRDEAIELSVDFQEELMESGVRFYEHPPNYSEIRNVGKSITKIQTLAKGANISSYVESVLSNAKYSKCKLGAFRYSIDKSLYRAHDGYKDATFLQGLSRCIELVLCELFPSVNLILENKNVSFSIWFASKQTDLTDPHIAEATASKYDFRLESPGSSLVEAIGGFGRAYSVFLDSIGHRDCFTEAVSALVILRTRKIPYQEDPSKRGGYGNDDKKPRTYQPPIHWYCPVCGIVNYPDMPLVSGQRSRPCGKCYKPTLADYSVLSHLADASLFPELEVFPNPELGGAALSLNCSFDVCAGPILDDFLYTNKLLDQCRKKEAFQLAYRNTFFLDGLQRTGTIATANICGPLHNKLVDQSRSIRGNEIVELSGLPLRGVFLRTSKSESKKIYSPGKATKEGATNPQNRSSSGNSGSTPHHQTNLPKSTMETAGQCFMVFPGIQPLSRGTVEELPQIAVDVLSNHGLADFHIYGAGISNSGSLKFTFNIKDVPSKLLKQLVNLLQQRTISVGAALNSHLKSHV